MLPSSTKNRPAPSKPGSEAESILKQLGLNAAELRRIDPAEALQRVAIAFQQFETTVPALSHGVLFNKQTREGAAYLKDLAESGKLVATVTTQQADEAEKLNKELFLS